MTTDRDVGTDIATRTLDDGMDTKGKRVNQR
jgi:hypothetical protein